jgi:hypothetical protein
MGMFIRDLRYALRQMRKSPRFTLTAVLIPAFEENAHYDTRSLELRDGWLTCDEVLASRAKEVNAK